MYSNRAGSLGRRRPARQSLSGGGHMRSRLFLLALVLMLICAPAAVSQQQTSNDTPESTTARVFELVLPSEHLLGDWGGLRPKLEESGIVLRVHAECVLRKPIRDPSGCAGHASVHRHLDGAGEGEAYQAKPRDGRASTTATPRCATTKAMVWIFH